MTSDEELIDAIKIVLGPDEMSDQELNKHLHFLEESCPGLTDVLFQNNCKYSPKEAIRKARENFRVFSSGRGGTSIKHPHAPTKDEEE